ncbi:MAG: hypothetical protein IPG06_18305, partial [Haliea sp.]|nr:hypothetical protein [Haliea sp.]
MRDAAPEVKLGGPASRRWVIRCQYSTLMKSRLNSMTTAQPAFDIVTYHFYGAVAERCVPPDSPAGVAAEQALTEEWLARPDKQFQRHQALRDKYAPGAPIWLTETGTASCGGTRWQPTFLETFRFVDTHA